MIVRILRSKLIGQCMLVCGAALLLCAPKATPQTTARAAQASEERDGQHDFDFQFGSWKVHNRRLLHPLTGSNEWVEFDGTVVARPVWGGRANMDEFEADAPSGHIEGMTVRTYNAKAHEWSIYWANQRTGVVSLPATVGKFNDHGIGEFYDQEEFNGRTIFVRFIWTVQSAEQTRWEQAFSIDGGKTWETNWIITASKVKE
ncbi:MAG: hypothetical protein WB607_21150 [Candidatus Acidiferrum sp.]|jgi:hypothetical protein